MQHPDVVVDVGNTRIKWGLCGPDAVLASASLPADAAGEWQAQLEHWQLRGRLGWAVTGVHPQRRDQLVEWARQRGDVVQVIDDWQQVPLRILLPEPQKAGIDRLLDAVAANSRRSAGTPAVVIDAGSAVTVDWLDESGAFAGGAIFPGLHLMACALHDYTALLPLIEVFRPFPALPGNSTRAAMETGIFWGVAGGIRALVAEMAARCPLAPELFLTGGDGHLFQAVLPGAHFWPHMTLEGIRLTADSSR
jgi:type III pantothenate kinase